MRLRLQTNGKCSGIALCNATMHIAHRHLIAVNWFSAHYWRMARTINIERGAEFGCVQLHTAQKTHQQQQQQRRSRSLNYGIRYECISVWVPGSKQLEYVVFMGVRTAMCEMHMRPGLVLTPIEAK